MASAQTDVRSVSVAIPSDTVQVGEAFTITWTVRGAVTKVEALTIPGMPAVAQPGIKSLKKWLDGIRSDETTYTLRVLALQGGVQDPPVLKVIWEGDAQPHHYSSKAIVVVGTSSASEEQMMFRFSPERPESTRMVQFHDGKGFVTERKDGKDELLRYLGPKEVKCLEKLLR
jgi:hypothetical protein